eukprot:CAMPEP_0170550278 /NCGR_PEP_ID=MMETSP0211-20121228/8345_1 /TAXON_ID=311385 /ORGANISM="Pseudokeronopsis sp., Strain OXSARD2" /LENGTH=311 /DNA_ID=CAMNT_0010856739 /DNA_START=1436 /DNA_END=2371 /DNA_ORIENTATION=-
MAVGVGLAELPHLDPFREAEVFHHLPPLALSAPIACVHVQRLRVQPFGIFDVGADEVLAVDADDEELFEEVHLLLAHPALRAAQRESLLRPNFEVVDQGGADLFAVAELVAALFGEVDALVDRDMLAHDGAALLERQRDVQLALRRISLLQKIEVGHGLEHRVSDLADLPVGLDGAELLLVGPWDLLRSMRDPSVGGVLDEFGGLDGVAFFGLVFLHGEAHFLLAHHVLLIRHDLLLGQLLIYHRRLLPHLLLHSRHDLLEDLFLLLGLVPEAIGQLSHIILVILASLLFGGLAEELALVDALVVALSGGL